VHRYTDSTVTLDLDGTTLTLPKSKIMNIATQRQNGGMTWIELRHRNAGGPGRRRHGHRQLRRPEDSRAARVRREGGRRLHVSQQLPMDHDEDAEDEKPKAKGRNGTQPAAH
jgi:hypothetical protein